MAATKQLKKYMMTFATPSDIAAAKAWVAAHGVEVLRLLDEREEVLLSAWKRLFTAQANERRKAFLGLDETVRHLLLVRASELCSDLAADPRLPGLDELSQRFLLTFFEQYVRTQATKQAREKGA